MSPDDLLPELDQKLLPYCAHVSHPGYFGLITPTPTPIGILGDLLASALNQNLGAWTIGPSAVAMERRVVRWLCDLAGYDAASDGNLTSGGMMANFIGLKLARDAGDRRPRAARWRERALGRLHVRGAAHLRRQGRRTRSASGETAAHPADGRSFRLSLMRSRPRSRTIAGKAYGRSASSRSAAPRTPARSTTCRAAADRRPRADAGCTSTRRTAAGC